MIENRELAAAWEQLGQQMAKVLAPPLILWILWLENRRFHGVRWFRRSRRLAARTFRRSPAPPAS